MRIATTYRACTINHSIPICKGRNGCFERSNNLFKLGLHDTKVRVLIHYKILASYLFQDITLQIPLSLIM